MEQRQAWFKFCPQDWLGDELLRSCLPATRGFWMDCLCIMHRATPRGYLLVNKQPPTDRELATMTAMTVREMRTAREEVIRKGVCGVTEWGVIFSRRMVRDTERASLTAARVRDHRLRNADGNAPVTQDVTLQKRSTRARSQRSRVPENQTDPPTTKKERPIFDAGTVVVFPWMEAHYRQLLTQTKRDDFDLFAWYQHVADDLQARGEILQADQRHRYLTERLIRDAGLPKPSLTRPAAHQTGQRQKWIVECEALHGGRCETSAAHYLAMAEARA